MTAERPTYFGSGWISGVLSTVLGTMGMGGVLAILFPTYLTTPDLRAVYPMEFMRGLIHVILVGAFVLGFVSVVLRRNKTLGLTGLILTTFAGLLGGSQVPVGSLGDSPYLGLDWFLLNLLVLSLLFVPLERLFARLKDQEIFRQGWRTDLIHFFMSHLFVQVSVFLALMPAKVLFSWAISSRLQHTVASQPFLLQFVEILVVSDFAEYWLHRMMHRVKILWPFHAIHHSCERMDWLAASRLHLVDIVVVRAVTFVPLFVLGFASGPILAYLVFVSFHAIFIHANVKFRFGWLERVLVTPRFHHWHHGIEAKAIDKNFAVHLPVLDWLFGSYLLPKDEWPSGYGIEGNPVPENYIKHVLYPFLPNTKR